MNEININEMGSNHNTQDGYVCTNIDWYANHSARKTVSIYVRGKSDKYPTDPNDTASSAISKRHKKKIVYSAINEELEFFNTFDTKTLKSLYVVNGLIHGISENVELSHQSILHLILGLDIQIPKIVYYVWYKSKEDVYIDVTDNEIIFLFGKDNNIIIKFPLMKWHNRMVSIKSREPEEYITDEHTLTLMKLTMSGLGDNCQEFVRIDDKGFLFNEFRSNEFRINFLNSLDKTENPLKEHYVFSLDSIKKAISLAEEIAFYRDCVEVMPNHKALEYSYLQFKTKKGVGEIRGYPMK